MASNEEREGFSGKELEFEGESASQDIDQAHSDAQTDGRLEDVAGVEPQSVSQAFEDAIQNVTGTNH